MKKYALVSLLLLAGSEAISLAALIIISIMVLLDMARAAEKKGV